MTKVGIANVVYAKVGGFSKKEAVELVDLLFDAMKESLGRGDKVKLSGFGSFVLRDKRSRKGRNPQTGESLYLAPRRVLAFKPSPMLRELLNRSEPPKGAPPSETL